MAPACVRVTSQIAFRAGKRRADTPDPGDAGAVFVPRFIRLGSRAPRATKAEATAAIGRNIVGAEKGSEEGGAAVEPSAAAQDMAGNIAEWTNSWSDPNAQENRVLRGGTWLDSSASFFTALFRNDNIPSYRSSSLGFRCSRSPAP